MIQRRGRRDDAGRGIDREAAIGIVDQAVSQDVGRGIGRGNRADDRARSAILVHRRMVIILSSPFLQAAILSSLPMTLRAASSRARSAR